MDTSVALSVACPFVLADGSKCLSEKIVARGYCEKHYRSLRRAGAFDDLVSKPSRQSGATRFNTAAVRRARRKLLKFAPDFVDHLAMGSLIAAKNGKTEPAQWALLHTRVIDPVSDKSNVAQTPTTINIGVKVSGQKDRE